MPFWSDFRKAAKDRPAEIMGRSILTSLGIPWKKYVVYYRPIWRCACGKQFDFKRDADIHIQVTHSQGQPEHMFYEVDLRLWEKDVYEFDGIQHSKGKGPKHDAERDEFLRKEYGLTIHRWPNNCVLKHAEVYEAYSRNLKRLHELETNR